MPAKDRYHDIVKHALEKDGWRVIKEQAVLQVSKRTMWVDIQAERDGGRITILVEVKGMDGSMSPVEALMDAAGKYVVYQTAILFRGYDVPLYLAVPNAAYNTILSEPLGLSVRERLSMKLIVIDLEREEVTQWID